MVNKIHLIDPMFKHCQIGSIPNGDHQIEAISLSSMVRILVASSGYQPASAYRAIAANFLQLPSTITESTEFVIVDDLEANWPEGLPG